jgi:hypothetical protein
MVVAVEAKKSLIAKLKEAHALIEQEKADAKAMDRLNESDVDAKMSVESAGSANPLDKVQLFLCTVGC